MALINCPQCGKQVSNKAVICPHCGWNVTTNTSQTEKKVLDSERTTIKVKHRKWPLLIILGVCLAAVAVALWFFVIHNVNEAEKAIVENTETKHIPDPSLPDERYLTQDLRMWWLFGPVRSFQTSISRIDGPSRWDEYILEYYSEERLYDNLSISIQFDAQGHFSNTIDGSFTIDEITKKDGDRILVAEGPVAIMDFHPIKQWKYYPNGLVKQWELTGFEGAEKCQYYYNDAGELIKTETNSGYEGTMLKTITTYSIKERDKYGNWTKQIAEVTESEFDYEKNEYITQAVRHEMYTRIIYYYDQDSSCQYVVINATELRLRWGPSTSAGILRWEDGSERYPKKGEIYPYWDESGDFYKIEYNGYIVWVSKKYTYLE